MFGFSSNPVLNNKSFYASANERRFSFSIASTLNKALLLLAVTCFAAYFSWVYFYKFLPNANIAITISGLIAFITAMVIRYKKDWASFLSFIYALAKGIFLGLISVRLENKFPGIVFQAVLLTILVFIVMLTLYKLRIVKVTQQLRSIIYAATGAIIIIYLISFVLYLFNLPPIPYIHENGVIGILFSVFVSVVASFHILFDIAFIERSAYKKFPFHMEWYAAFGLLVSIVWQYLSLLRLLKKVKSYN